MKETSNPLPGLARYLVAAGQLDVATVKQGLTDARAHDMPLIPWLVQARKLSAKAVQLAAAEQFGLPLMDLGAWNPAFEAPKELVTEKLARQYYALPLYVRRNKLYVAMVDPSNPQAFMDLQFASGLSVEAVLVEADKLHSALDRHFESNGAGGMGDLSDDSLTELGVEMGPVADEEVKSDEDEGPVVRFVNKMLLSAIRKGSSDLHFEPYEKTYRVRFRTDGVLHEVARPPIQLVSRISARLKVMSSMDIAERRKPQDGRIKLKISKNKSIDFRVNTLPTLWGEKIVLRILDSASAKMGIDALGYEPHQKELYLQTLKQPQGMILVTGPTGSGKTVSLYTGLNILNTSDVNISTAEDPVEINLEGINQVNVNPKQGMDFSQALRAFLRQDPDVIMVGEVRDLETAEIAIKAAQTGHMVMSTLHTNSAAETLTRLRNMGVASFNIATSVNLIIAQRLARRLCPKCKQEMQIPEAALREEGFTDEELAQLTLYGPVGCPECTGGYKGRVGIYEVVKITPALQDLIMTDGNSIEISNLMRAEGFSDLRASARLKVVQGMTSLAEINRVTKD